MPYEASGLVHHSSPRSIKTSAYIAVTSAARTKIFPQMNTSALPIARPQSSDASRHVHCALASRTPSVQMQSGVFLRDPRTESFHFCANKFLPPSHLIRSTEVIGMADKLRTFASGAWSQMKTACRSGVRPERPQGKT